MYKILIADDEKNIRNLVKIALIENNFEVIEAKDGEEAIQKIKLKKPDLIILDIMMPKKSGLEIAKALKMRQNKIPIMMLTARSTEADRIAGLKLDIDDYLTKPFSVEELILRITSILKRYKQESYNKKELVINSDNFTIRRNGSIIELYKKEHAILLYLYENQNRYVTREELLIHIGNTKNINETRTIDIHISKIRKALNTLQYKESIVSKRGVGYRLKI